MRLVSVSLRNFRCYRDETTIQLDDLTTIIGENDVGKSSILEALEIFFNSEIVKIDSDDCHVSSEERVVEITCEFSGLPQTLVLDTQAKTSLDKEYLLTNNGTLRVQKRFNCAGKNPKSEVFVLAYHPTKDQYDDLLELTNSTLKRRIGELHIDESGIQLNNNPSMRHAIWDSCLDLQLGDTCIPVAKGAGKQIWEKLNDHLPLFALFRSDRPSQDSDSEVQDPMKLAIATALSDTSIIQKLSDVTEAVREKAVELAERTHQTLTEIKPDLARQLTPEFRSDPNWSRLFSLSLNSDDGIPVNKRGSGVRRMILVSFFRAEAERKLAQEEFSNIIYGFEEPETSQHPDHQRILLESFQSLSSESRCQVILTTHSPGVAGYMPTSSFRFIRRGSNGHPQVDQGTDATLAAVSKTLGVMPDPTNGQVCLLVCVEGPNDVKAVGCLSSALHKNDPNLPDLQNNSHVAIVPLGGSNLKHWANSNYLKNLGLPEVHIYDNDIKKYVDAVRKINLRGNGSWAVQTKKLEIENYLHPEAIKEALSVDIQFGDMDDVSKLISDELGQNLEKKLNPGNVKKRLADSAFPKMTAERIKARDPSGEVERWFRRMGEMLPK